MQPSTQNVLTDLKKENQRLSLPGIVAAAMFACGPFMFATIGGRGLFLYMAVLFFLSIFVQAFFIDSNRSLNLKPSPELKRALFPFLACLFWQLFSFLWSAALSTTTIYAYIKIMMFFLFLSIPRYTGADKKLMVIAQIPIVCIATLLMITSGDTISEVGSERLTFSFFGIPQDPNYLAYFFIAPMLFLFAIVISKKKRLIWRILCLVLLLFLSFGVLTTGSRGALIGIGIAILVYFFRYKKMAWWKGAIALALLLLLLYLFLTFGLRFLPESVAERFTIENVIESGGSNRTSIWKKFCTAIFSSPLILLFGAGNSTEVFNLQVSAHNYLLESWYEYGVVGVALLVFFFRSSIKKALAKENHFIFCMLICALIMALFLSVSRMLPFWLCITLSNILCLSDKSRFAAHSHPQNIEKGNL